MHGLYSHDLFITFFFDAVLVLRHPGHDHIHEQCTVLTVGSEIPDHPPDIPVIGFPFLVLVASHASAVTFPEQFFRQCFIVVMVVPPAVDAKKEVVTGIPVTAFGHSDCFYFHTLYN